MSILQAIATQWLLDFRTMSGLAGIVERHAAGEKISADAIAAVVAARDAKAASRPWDTMLSSKSPADQKNGFYMLGSVAVVPIEGVLAARASMVNNVSSPTGMSAEEVIRSVTNAAEAAAATPGGAMVLHMDSPGGTVAGTSDMADAIKAAAARVPVIALSNNQACSGCYWLACMCDGIMASPLAEVGSIGVYMAVPDTSRALENAGVKINIVKRGENKAIGAPGTPVTDAQLAVLQKSLDVMYEGFVKTVMDGRGLSRDQALALADGASHTVPAATDGNPLIASRMIDRVGSLTDAVAWAASLGKTRTTRGTAAPSSRKPTMNLEQLKTQHPTLVEAIRTEAKAEADAAHATALKTVTEAARAEGAKAEREKQPEPATIDELETIVPTALAGRDTLILGMVKTKATASQAREQVTAKLLEQTTALSKDLAEQKKMNDGLGKNGLGADPLKFKAEDKGAGEFEKIVLGIAANEKCSVETALGKAVKDKGNRPAHNDWVSRGCPAIQAA